MKVHEYLNIWGVYVHPLASPWLTYYHALSPFLRTVTVRNEIPMFMYYSGTAWRFICIVWGPYNLSKTFAFWSCNKNAIFFLFLHVVVDTTTTMRLHPWKMNQNFIWWHLISSKVRCIANSNDASVFLCFKVD